MGTTVTGSEARGSVPDGTTWVVVASLAFLLIETMDGVEELLSLGPTGAIIRTC